MSRTDDILDKTKRKEPEVKKWKVVVGIVVGLGFSFVLFSVLGGFIVSYIVTDYVASDKVAPVTYDFYDASGNRDDEISIYFMGSSIVADAVYPTYINTRLREYFVKNVTTYVIHAGGDTPLQRVPEVQKIINSKPSLVIYGVTYRSVIDTHWTDERVVLVHNRLNIRNDSLYLFSEEELSDIQQTPDVFYMKKFIAKALEFKISPWDSFSDGVGYTLDSRLIRSSMKNQEQIVLELTNSNDVWRPVVTNETTRHKEALVYIVKTLQNEGIPVILINMPLNPLTSEKITDESRNNFYDLLNETGAKWYDMEKDYDEEYFWDSHHMNYEGALEFSPVMADLIIQELS